MSNDDQDFPFGSSKQRRQTLVKETKNEIRKEQLSDKELFVQDIKPIIFSDKPIIGKPFDLEIQFNDEEIFELREAFSLWQDPTDYKVSMSEISYTCNEV